MRTETAKQFYKEIEGESEKYRLVNDNFIVKYIDKEVCVSVGEFYRHGTAGNESKTNLIFLNNNDKPQMFNKKMNSTTTGLGIWKNLDIKFIEKPIEEILK